MIKRDAIKLRENEKRLRLKLKGNGFNSVFVNTTMPASSMVNIDLLNDEPEVPLTGYNYCRFKNEGTVLY